MSAYVRVPTDTASCPTCRQRVSLLCPAAWDGDAPAFSICFGCQWIGQVGVGPVHAGVTATADRA